MTTETDSFGRSATRLRRAALTVIAVLVQMSWAVAQPAPSHVLSGIVVDSATGRPVANIRVQVLWSSLATETDADGAFKIERVPDGTIQLRLTHVGYEPRTVTLVIGPDAVSTSIRIELRTRVIPQPPITVFGEGTRIIAAPGHSTTLSAERLRRNPGSLSDVSRAVSRIPEVTPLMDVLNLYSVRGGAPLENGFNIDGIDLPDISHLPNQGSTGGAVGLINPEFVEEVRLHSGAFDAAYGGRMSSILEVDWRNPRTDAWHGTADFSAAGARLSVDGPISPHASLMVSAHHSYLDRLLDESGLGVSPRFNDYQGKFHLRLSDRQSVAAIGLLGVDNFEVSRENAMDAGGGVYYGEWDALPHAVGVTWDAAWSDRLATRAVVSRAVTSFDYHFWDIQTSRETYLNKSIEATLTARGDLLWKISGRFSLRSGMEWKRFTSDVLNEDRSMADRYGRFVNTAVLIDRHYEDGLGAVYSSLTAQVGGGFEAALGGRIWYFSRTDQGRAEPRARLTWKPDESFEVGIAAGSIHQQLPYTLLAQRDSHSRIASPRSDHLIGTASLEPGLGVTLRLGLYRKFYHNLPVDPTLPRVFVLDEVISREFFHYSFHPTLLADGEARSQGGEFLIGREADYGLRGNLGISLSDAKYRDSDGIWRERVIDIEHAVTAELGFRTRNGWTFTSAWRQIGGLRRTPYDVYLSSYYGTAVEHPEYPNYSRLPTLHWLDVRLERKLRLGRGDLTLHAGVWNVYDAEEITVIFWSNRFNATVHDVQFSPVPVFGVIYSF